MYTICVLSGAHVIIICLIIIGAYLVLNKGILGTKNSNDATNSNNGKGTNEQEPPRPILHIPDTCPFCKRPNTRRTRLCEWCGEQIC